jgi:hypothetical protein
LNHPIDLNRLDRLRDTSEILQIRQDLSLGHHRQHRSSYTLDYRSILDSERGLWDLNIELDCFLRSYIHRTSEGLSAILLGPLNCQKSEDHQVATYTDLCYKSSGFGIVVPLIEIV